MEVKKFEGLSYSQVRTKIASWLLENPGVEILKVRDRRSMKKRIVWIFYRRRWVWGMPGGRIKKKMTGKKFPANLGSL